MRSIIIIKLQFSTSNEARGVLAFKTQTSDMDSFRAMGHSNSKKCLITGKDHSSPQDMFANIGYSP